MFVLAGLNLVENYPYEAIEKGYDFVRLASITAELISIYNVDDVCQKLRTEYVSTCIKPSTKSGLCNRSRCNKALRRFFDRVPPEYTHELLFCPCSDMACSERRRQTIVPSCSYEGEDKPSCLSQMRICKADYVCRSRLAQFQYDCQPEEQSATGCKQGNYAACLIAYTGLIGSPITPNYVDNSTSSVSPWCSCSASGNLRDQCTEFLNYFTDNPCLNSELGMTTVNRCLDAAKACNVDDVCQKLRTEYVSTCIKPSTKSVMGSLVLFRKLVLLDSLFQ
ncbi:GDNF family receptor alpha-4-like [Sinocyclocheilus grahami]|uniref:GDNF family receptor alpha-4-like n=1 Tax=Sinocyclocheilus grahami TaxID=75366 RepID=UPI0007AC6611|nr:PREDICTED: GDNF family receptor alpha-4-like [Sinocyclocheilus grahami]